MRTRLPVFASVLLGIGGAQVRAAAAELPSPAPAYDELDVVLVTGERPGPALWKVTYKGNTLWLLPTFGPLPDKLVWRSTQIESVIRQSQAVYADARVAVQRVSGREMDSRLWKALTNEEGKLLSEVMPPHQYRRFQELNGMFAGASPMVFERFRPYQAADLLRDAAMRRLTLASDGGITATVRTLALRYEVDFLAPRPIGSHEWDKAISELDRTPRQADLSCAEAKLARLETDLREAVIRANAWSRGDIQALRADKGLLAESEPDIPACRQFYRHMNFVTKRMKELRRDSFSTYQRALRKNASTLVLVSIGDLFDEDGLLARFAAAGYEIEEPPGLTPPLE